MGATVKDDLNKRSCVPQKKEKDKGTCVEKKIETQERTLVLILSIHSIFIDKLLKLFSQQKKNIH